MQADLQQQIERAAKILKSSLAPLFLSGAGISAESGIPTFRRPLDVKAADEGTRGAEVRSDKDVAAVDESTRGAAVRSDRDVAAADESADALWQKYNPEDLATPAAFARDPALVWSWYNWRKRLIAEKKPNPAHYAAADLKLKLPQLLAATQNVDGFHKLAGLESILEMHGNIYRTRCLACGAVHENRADVFADTPCSACDQPRLRPDIVWFGEALPQGILHAIYERLSHYDAVLVVGTSGTVYPAAGFAVEVRRREGHVIEINLDHAPQHYTNDVYLRGRAGDILPRIVERI